MQKPNNFESTETRKDFEPITLGGHFGVIMEAVETTSKSGKPMLRVAFDFDASDPQPKYFTEKYKADTREDKKWPWQAYAYILSEDADGNTNKRFKQFCEDVEASNPGFELRWGEDFSAQLKGKKVGIVYGEEEYLGNDGNVGVSARYKWTCPTDKVNTAKIPDLKKLPSTPAGSSAVMTDSSWLNVSANTAAELPFLK